MKNTLLLLFIIFTFFTGCGRPDMMAYYKQDPAQSKFPHAWQELLLLPQEYLPKSSIKHFQLPALMHYYQKNNPGFIDLKKFQNEMPHHELSRLHLWYAASFFHKPYITHYMVMEFRSEVEAKNYVKKLAAKDPAKYQRVLRYKTILFSFTIRDFHQKLVDKSVATESEAWIDATIQRMREKL